jgi:hypothetical protein
MVGSIRSVMVWLCLVFVLSAKGNIIGNTKMIPLTSHSALAHKKSVFNENTIYNLYRLSSDQVDFGVKYFDKFHLIKASNLSKYNTTKPNSIILINNRKIKNFNKVDGIGTVEVMQNGGYTMKRINNNTIAVIAGDDAGLMYGIMDLSDALLSQKFNDIKDKRQEPYIAQRGVKFNLPLDARTPTYNEPSDAVQENIKHMWDIGFWKAYIDQLAIHRYNFISLWSLHPFPSMVKVPGFEKIALDDVMQSQGSWNEYYSTRTTDFEDTAIMNHLKIVKKISIDKKIAFWKEVMDYGAKRNVSFYVVTWNVYTNGINGKYGITNDIKNENTKAYYRAAVNAMYDTYPLLKGMGLTTGENMDASALEKEEWVWQTYGLGTLDAAKKYKQRTIELVHRQHEASAADIKHKFSALLNQQNVKFYFSFKYAQAHVMSFEKQNFHINFLNDISPTKTWWTLRNDDNYLFRWAAPQFVKSFIQHIPIEPTAAIYYGSDQHVWGKASLEKNTLNAPLEIDKHWLHWLLWGRTAYDTSLNKITLAKLVNKRMGLTHGAELLTAWEHASMVYPLTTGFHWGALDFQWYIEACKSRPGPANTESGFHDINRFITLGVHPSSSYINISDYVKAETSSIKTDGVNPLQLADNILNHVSKAQAWLDGKPYSPPNVEYEATCEDISTVVKLGRYYAHKIKAATHLAMYRATKNNGEKSIALQEINIAITYWHAYVASVKKVYRDKLWFNRVGYVDWDLLSTEAEKDLAIIQAE